MAALDDDRVGVAWFAFDGGAVDGRPSAWRADLLAVLRRFDGCARPDDVVLAASELVSNGVEHGGGVRRLHVEGRGGAVTVEVEDFGSSLSAPAPTDIASDRGRGLQIVAEVCDTWGWWPTAAGKTVWATFLPESVEPVRPAALPGSQDARR